MTIITDKIQNQLGGPVELVKQSAAKLWASYNGVNSTVRDSLNMSSAIDNGVGRYTFNFTNSMGNDSYAVGGAFGSGTGSGQTDSSMELDGTLTPTPVRVGAIDLMVVGTSFTDAEWVTPFIHGDLA